MNNKALLAASLIAVFVIGYYGASSVAFAQYMGNVGEAGETGVGTLEETLELARRRIEAAEAIVIFALRRKNLQVSYTFLQLHV